ncbi:hypothetical protein [Saccharopolyspora gloriosae]|uniref:hypothetical protein n=1 Tax=Saccharopolyspora gloriosae TaxID=455344 RepID=UPI001FB60FEB|nr:hypothetical protein [Saccharopolyspora gloriosae]
MDLGRRVAAVTAPALVRGLLDDAAVFPPGLLPLPDAARAHARHRSAAHADAVGPLVVPSSALAEPEALEPIGDAALSVTVPAGPAGVADALAATRFSLRALEIPVPDEMTADSLRSALERVREATDAEVFVEIPRDARRAEVLALLAPLGCRAKFRTGGVRAELYPPVPELAEAIEAVVRAGVPFKATAGLHHAVRNTDPETGFDQHGFLNILLAVDSALRGGTDLERLLADRDAAGIAERVTCLGEQRVRAARERFASFGTCSITDPLTELAGLGLIPDDLAHPQGATA